MPANCPHLEVLAAVQPCGLEVESIPAFRTSILTNTFREERFHGAI